MNNMRNLLTALLLVIGIVPLFAEISETVITPENAKAQVVQCEVLTRATTSSPYGQVHGVLISLKSKISTDSFDIGVQVWNAGQYVATFTPARASVTDVPIAFKASAQNGACYYFEATEAALERSSVSFVYEKRGYTLMFRDWLKK
jgi:hypothetical protein